MNIVDILSDLLIGGAFGLFVIFGLSYLGAGRSKDNHDADKRLRYLLVEYKEWCEKDTGFDKNLSYLLSNPVSLSDDKEFEYLERELQYLRIKIEREYEKAMFLNIDAEPNVRHLIEKREKLETKIAAHPDRKQIEKQRHADFKEQFAKRRNELKGGDE